ncbi:MAG: hypothetical protein QM582_08890 [Micropruina sp.]|uniref:hypothetical protein n=1 Tax=Micropruina sp. TaxID=2737536 RepID=UPI0039E539CA
MEPTNYQLALAHADELAGQGGRSARWLARYYLVFGVASLLIAVAFGVLSGLVWTIVLTVLWAALITGISIYAGRQRTMVRGGGRVHAWVMTVWTLLWAGTVVIGSSYRMPWPWWLAGGLALLATCAVGSWTVLRRTGVRP